MKNKLIIFSVFAIALAIAGFVIANGQSDLQNEMDGLINDLQNEGYGWLVDYNDSLPEDTCQYISTIDGVKEEAWYKTYLTNLKGSYNVFDLKVLGWAEFDYIVDPIELNLTNATSNLNVTNESGTFGHLSVSEPSLVLYMPFDYPKENASWVAGNWSGALSFDGSNDYVTMGDVLDFGPQQNFSISFWTNLRGISGSYGGFVNKGGFTGAGGNGYFISLQNGATMLRYGISNGTQLLDTSGAVFTYNTWYNVVGVVNRNQNMTIYINGTQVDTFNISRYADENLGTNFYNLQFGTWGGYFLNGTIDEVMIFNRTLNDTEISSLYNSNIVLNSTGLVGEWKLDDGTGFNAKDTSGENNYGEIKGQRTGTEYDFTNNSNDGTATNGASYTSNGWIGGGYEFDGVNDYVSIPNSASLNPTTELTISMWIKPSSTYSSTDQRFVAKYSAGTGYDFSQNGAGDLRITINANFTDALMAYNKFNYDEWSFITATFDNGDAKIYVNGINVANKTLVDSVINSNTASLMIGTFTSTLKFFNGSLDDVMIFNKSLSETEIQQIYNSSYSRFFPTGEMLFQNLNFSANNTVNITLDDCQTLKGSSLQGKINDGDWNNFSGCSLTDYEFTSTENDNFTIRFNAGDYNFYSPLIVGNFTQDADIVLEDYETDQTAPTISFESPTPENNSYVSSTTQTIIANISDNSDTNTSSFIDFDRSLVGYWAMDYYNSTGVFDNSTYCYDNKTRILTENGWKYFYDLNDSEEVATLNSETGELEWQLPLEKQEFNKNGEMYKIVLEDGSDLLVSPEHRVYVNENLEKINKDATKVASMVKYNVLARLNILSNNNYIKFSINNGFAEYAPVASMVKHQSNKLGPSGHSGSNPGWGDSAFSLQQITKVYYNLESRNEIYFLDGNNNPIKVKSISKENYNGKIYDVDVENDIVLVRRENGTALWSGNSNFGTFNGAGFGSSNISQGKRGNGLSFDGSNDYVGIADANSLDYNGTINKTISFWFKSNEVLGIQTILSKWHGTGNEYIIYLSSSTLTLQAVDTGTSATLAGISANTWYNVVAVMNSTKGISLYVNGTLKSSYIDTGSVASTTTTLRLGQNQGTNWFNGSIDEVMIFDKSLSQSEVSALYNSKANKFNATFSSLSTGQHNYTLYANDEAGNLNTSTNRQFTIDTIYPLIDFTTGTEENNSYKSQNWTFVNVSVTDTNAGSTFVDFTNDLLGWWRMDDYNSTGIYDNSSYSNFGTFNGGLNYSNLTTGKRGNALSFDGVNNYVQLNSSVAFADNTSWSVNLWVKGNNFETGAVNQFLIQGTTASYGVTYYAQNRIVVYCGSYASLDWNEVYAFSNNVWYDLTIVSGGQNVSLYVNGNLISTKTPTDGFTNMSFYKMGRSTAQFFNGSMDDVMIFNRSLSASEILSLYNSTRYEHNFTSLNEGSYDYKAYTQDLAGNVNSTETRTINLDTTAPQVEITSPTASQTLTSASVTFSATTNENSTCNYSIDAGATNYTLTANATDTGFTAARTLTNANYVLNVYCSDVLGNANNTQNVSFTVAVPSAVTDTGTGGSGGGGFKPSVEFNINLNENYQKTINLNRIEFDRLTITNTGDLEETYEIKVEVLEGIISFDENVLIIPVGESGSSEFKITSPNKTGVYTGKIIISCGTNKKEILITLNINTEKSLFDITLNIPKSLKVMNLNNNLRAEINLLQMGIKEQMDVTLNYVIKDFSGVAHVSESETIAVYEQKSIEKEFYTEELEAGDYVLGVELIYPNGVAVASSQFKIKDKMGLEINGLLLLGLFLAVLFIFVSLIIIIKRYKRIEKHIKSGKVVKNKRW